MLTWNDKKYDNPRYERYGDVTQIAKGLVGYRKLKRMRQVDLSKLVGVSSHKMSRYERGIEIPDEVTMIRLCLTLDISFTELLKALNLKPVYDNKVSGTIRRGVITPIEEGISLVNHNLTLYRKVMNLISSIDKDDLLTHTGVDNLKFKYNKLVSEVLRLSEDMTSAKQLLPHLDNGLLGKLSVEDFHEISGDRSSVIDNYIRPKDFSVILKNIRAKIEKDPTISDEEVQELLEESNVFLYRMSDDICGFLEAIRGVCSCKLYSQEYVNASFNAIAQLMLFDYCRDSMKVLYV